MYNKPIAEHLPQLRASNLKQQGFFNDEYWQDDYDRGSHDPFRMLSQSNNGFNYTIKTFGHRTSLELVWEIGGERYRSTISLVNKRVNFGGYRYWFMCPNCSNRRGVLYIIQHVCGCNICLKIAYKSQNRTKAKPLSTEELDERSQRLTDIWLTLWRKGRFFYDNRPTTEYLHYLVLAEETWSFLFEPKRTVLMHQAHDPRLFKPPHVLINGR